jgi:SulP family sulfate permease
VSKRRLFFKKVKYLKSKYLAVRFFPLRNTFRNYSLDKLKSDFKGGLTVAMLEFPQGMAYAMVAGLPIQTGVYTSIIASWCGPFFSSARFGMFGPTNSTAVLLLSSFLAIDLPKFQYLVATSLVLIMVATFLMLAAVLRLGSLIRFVSRSVTSGYVTASLLLIIVNQLSRVCGYSVPSASTFIEVFKFNIQHLLEIHPPTLILSCLTGVTYFGLKNFYPRIPPIPATLVLIVGITAIFRLYTPNLDMLTVIEAGGWGLSFPELNFTLFSQLVQPAFAIAFLTILETSTASKALETQTGDHIDLNQQLFSLGACNLVNSFGSGMIASGSLTRSMLSLNGGSRTILSSFFSGSLLLLGLIFVGPCLNYVPRAALSTIILIVAASLINMRQIKIMMRCTKSDATVFILTFISGLIFHLETAIYLGATASIILFLQKASVPQLIEFDFNEQGELTEKPKYKAKGIPEISIVHVEGDLFFGSTDIFLEQARRLYEDSNVKVILLRMRNAHCIDATSAIAISDLAKFAKEKKRLLIVCGALPEIENVLRNSGLMETIEEENFFPYFPENPNKSTRLALIRAQKILGIDTKANIKLFIKAEEDPQAQ